MSSGLSLVWECTASGGEYRASVHRRDRDGLFAVEVWHRAYADGPKDEVDHWRLLKPMSLSDTEPAARRLARQGLEQASGELLDLTPYPVTLEWVRAFSGDAAADFLDPDEWEALTDAGPIDVYQVIRLSDLYLVRESEADVSWWMGSMSTDGELFCWGLYGTLYDAIEGR